MRIAWIAAVLLAFCVSCEKDPNDADTWVDQLDDRAKVNEALRHLERLADPASIKPLGEAWRKSNKQSNLLRALITVAGHVDPKADPKAAKGQWKDALPYLIEAVENFDPGSRRSIDDAMVACDALGRSKDPSVVPTLLAAAQKPLPKLHEGNHVKLAAIRALGNFDQPQVITALVQILETDPEKQIVRMNAAAALALAETGDPKALPTLLKATVSIGAIFQQTRAAVTRIGKPAVPALIKMFQEQDPDVQKIYNDKGLATKAPGVVVYRAALLLGDLRAKEAVPQLMAGLSAPPRIAFYDEKSGAPGPTTHEGILGALRQIMDPGSAAAVKAYWTNPKTDDGIRPVAIDVYSMLATDDSALNDLVKYIKDEQAEQQIRTAAIMAYGRLGKTKESENALDDLIAVYTAKIAKADEKAKSPKEEERATADDEKQVATYYRDQLTEAKTRIGIAVECGSDPMCYAKALPPTQKDFRAGQPGLPRAERALIELAKMGDKARPAADALLAAAESSERFVRQGVLLALPRVAALPCDKCAARLDEIIEKQADNTTLDFLTGETRVVHNYFLWAGK